MLNPPKTQGWMDAQNGLSPNPNRYGLAGNAYQAYMDGYQAFRLSLENKKDV